MHKIKIMRIMRIQSCIMMIGMSIISHENDKGDSHNNENGEDKLSDDDGNDAALRAHFGSALVARASPA